MNYISMREFLVRGRNYVGVVKDQVEDIVIYTTYNNLIANGRAWSEKNGELQFDSYFKDGFRHGITKDYRLDGKIITTIFEHGEVISQTIEDRID